MIFGWLGKRDGKNPRDAAGEYLGTLTGSSAAVLQMVLDWMEEQSESGNLGLPVLELADTRLEPVLAEIEAGIAKQRRMGTGHKLLRNYCERFARMYASVGRGTHSAQADKLLSYLRAAHLFSRACRLARMTHDDPGDLRKEILAVFLDAQQHGMTTQGKSPYAGTPKSTVMQETAAALLWETAPFDTLTLEQLEYLERFIVSQGAHIVLRTTPGTITPYAVLADGGLAAIEQANADVAVLFLGPGPLAGQLAGIAKLPDNGAFPPWAGTPLPHTSLQTLKSLALRMSSSWERKRVQRGSERRVRQDHVRVAGGFDNIRRVVAYSAYVRAGGQLDVYGEGRGRLITERMREVMVGLDIEKKQYTPVETLVAMEGIGDGNAVETWLACDSSDRGYNLTVPGYRGWLEVGGLLAMRENDQIDWQVAIVRRLYRHGQARRAGVEIFRGQPVPVGMGNEGQTTSLGLADLRAAILIAGDKENWLVTTFECTPGGSYLVVGSHGRQMFHVNARYWGSADFEIFTCEPVAAPPQ